MVLVFYNFTRYSILCIPVMSLTLFFLYGSGLVSYNFTCYNF